MLMRWGRCKPSSSSRPRTAVAAACLAAVVALGASAQNAPVAPPPIAKDAAPSERAQRDADKVFHWIMIQGDRTRKNPPAKDDKAAATAAPKPVRAAAAKSAADAGGDAPPVVRLRPDSAPAPSPATPLIASNQAPASSPATAAEAPIEKVENVAAPKVEVVEPPAAAPAPVNDTTPADSADVSLVPVAQSQPQFPLNLMRTLRRGTVQVRFSVRPDGSVGDVEVLSTSNPRLNPAAVAAMGQWRFQPIPREQSAAIELGFNLD